MIIEPEAITVLGMICDIQLEALHRIEKGSFTDADLVHHLIHSSDSEAWDSSIDRLIDIYKGISENAYLIELLDEYQLLTCSHILYVMSPSWSFGYSYGISSLWSVIHDCMRKFHPEYKLMYGKL